MASAATSTTSGNTIIDKIATKFNLKKADVKAVFDEDRAAHETEMQARYADKLKQAVTDGKLTQAQADLLTAKATELKTYMDTLSDKTPQERGDAMKTKLDELKTWATTNNIPTEYLPGPGGRGGMHRGMGMGGRGMMGSDADDATSSTSTTTN